MLKVNMSIGIVCMVNYTAIGPAATKLSNLTKYDLSSNVTVIPSETCSGIIVAHKQAVSEKKIKQN
jgi:hypothetical protein